MADPRFVGLVQSLLSSAQAALGETYSPATRQLAARGALARRTAEKSLGLLEMLEHKTRGNLGETERDILVKAIVAVRARLEQPAEPLN